MRNQPIPLVTGFYADESRPWSMQDCINYLPEAAEQDGTRTLSKLKTAPGLRPFSQFEDADAPIRGVWDVEGRLFAVAENSLFQLQSGSELDLLGSIPGVGVVRADHNQITGGNEVLFVNGSAGFVWNTQASTFTQITDPGYPGAIDVLFADGYLMQIEPGRRFAFHSDLADALSYNTLDRFTSEVSPDLLVGHAYLNNDYILFSESTTEFFENTGAAQQPWRSKRISFQKGCAGRFTIAQLDNTVMWLGDDGMFYKLEGYSPRRISTRPIEQAIKGANWSACVAFVWESEGHSVVYWTFPGGLTFGYDASQPNGFDWHRRESFGLTRWRVNSTAYWQRRWIAGDFQRGRLWEIDDDYFLEGDVEYISEIVGPVLHDNQNRVLMPRLEIVMDTGQPMTVPVEFPIVPTCSPQWIATNGGQDVFAAKADALDWPDPSVASDMPQNKVAAHLGTVVKYWIGGGGSPGNTYSNDRGANFLAPVTDFGPNSVKWINGKFWATGKSVTPTDPLAISSSFDGSTWDVDSVPGFGGHTDITGFPGLMVACDNAGRVVYSINDGVNWPGATVYGSSIIGYALANDGTTIILASDGGRLAKTTNGSTWTPIANPFSPAFGIKHLVYSAGLGVWVASNEVEIGYSVNGDDWFLAVLPGGWNIKALAANDVAIVAVGDVSANPAIFQTLNGAEWTQRTDSVSGGALIGVAAMTCD